MFCPLASPLRRRGSLSKSRATCSAERSRTEGEQPSNTSQGSGRQINTFTALDGDLPGMLDGAVPIADQWGSVEARRARIREVRTKSTTDGSTYEEMGES